MSIREFLGEEGNSVVTIALILIFIILVSIKPLGKLKNTISEGVRLVDIQMKEGCGLEKR